MSLVYSCRLSGWSNIHTFGEDFTNMVPHLMSRPVNPLFTLSYLQFAEALPSYGKDIMTSIPEIVVGKHCYLLRAFAGTNGL